MDLVNKLNLDVGGNDLVEKFGLDVPAPSGVNITKPDPNLVYSNNKGIVTEDAEGDYPVTFNFKNHHPEWDKKGPIGWIEAFKRQEKLELLPFVGGLALIDDFQALKSAKRLQAGVYDSDLFKRKDQENVNGFMLKLAEEEYRGTTWFADVYRNASILPGFMAEFFVTGPAAALGRTAVRKVIGKGAKTIAGRAVKKTAELAAGAAVRTPIMANRYIAKYNERQIFANVAATDKGINILNKSEEEPYTSAVKAVGDTFIEVFSETVGPFLRIPVGKMVSKVSPKFAAGAKKFWEGIPVKAKVARILEKGGFDGILEEMGEERVGDLMRASFNLEDFGAEDGNIMDRIAASIPDWYQLSVEAGTFAIPGAASFASRSLSEKLRKRGVESPENVIGALSENEIVSALDSIQLQEDALFERVLNKVGAFETLTEEEQAVVEERYFEYIEKTEGPIEPVEDKKMLDALRKADKEQQKLIEEELKQEFLKGKAEEGEVLFPETNRLSNIDKTGGVWGAIARENPGIIDKEIVTVYRATVGDEIRNNDFVALEKEIAEAALENLKDRGEEGKIISKEVSLSDLLMANDATEFVYSPVGRKPTPYQQAEQNLEELTQQKAETADILKAEQELFSQAKEERSRFLRSIKPTEDFKDELSQIPASLKSKESTQTLDQIAQREGFDDVSEFVKMLSSLEENVKSARAAIDVSRETIKGFREKTEARTKIEDLRQKTKDFKAGVRAGNIKTTADIKKAQEEFVALIKGSELEAKNKVKFITAVKNANSVNNLKKELDKYRLKAEELLIVQDKATISEKIKKELKTTFPAKKGQRRAAKYDFTTNKLLQDLNSFLKMTKKAATVELLNTPDPESETYMIRMRMLSLKAGGKFASPELYAKVYTDIKRLKDIGSTALSEADFEANIERVELEEEVLTKGMLVKEDKVTIKTKIVNIYRRGFSNQWSFLNSMFGKSIADKYNLEIPENEKDVAIAQKTAEAMKAAEDIYQTDNIPRLFLEMEKDRYELTGKDGTVSVSKHDLIDIYNSLKNDSSRASYYEHYGEIQINSLIDNLTENDKDFGDFLMDYVQEYGEILNERNIEQTGLDLGMVENYWPRTSEVTEDFYDGIRQQGEIATAQKARTTGIVKPIPSGAYLKAIRHMAQAEHVANVSRPYETVKRLFSRKKIKNQITNKYGDKVYRDLIAQLDRLSLNAQTENIDMVTGVLGKAVGNWVTSKIALSPTTFARQLGSAMNYSEQMNPVEWVKGFMGGIAKPKETFNFMWNNSPFLKARFNKGYSEALEDAIRGAEDIGKNFGQWTRFLTSFGRAGDVTAIVYGGYPFVKSEMKKGKSKEEAFESFRKATLRSQQSGLKSSLSGIQQKTSLKIFTAFQNTANQYNRKIVDSFISYQNGDITATQLLKTLTIYAGIQPLLYVALGQAAILPFKALGDALGLGDEEDIQEMTDELIYGILIQIAMIPVQALPIIKDMANFAARKATGQKAYKAVNIPLMDDLGMAAQRLAKEEITAEDYLMALAALQEPVTGSPAINIIRYFNYIVE